MEKCVDLAFTNTWVYTGAASAPGAAPGSPPARGRGRGRGRAASSPPCGSGAPDSSSPSSLSAAQHRGVHINTIIVSPSPDLSLGLPLLHDLHVLLHAALLLQLLLLLHHLPAAALRRAAALVTRRPRHHADTQIFLSNKYFWIENIFAVFRVHRAFCVWSFVWISFLYLGIGGVG